MASLTIQFKISEHQELIEVLNSEVGQIELLSSIQNRGDFTDFISNEYVVGVILGITETIILQLVMKACSFFQRKNKKATITVTTEDGTRFEIPTTATPNEIEQILETFKRIGNAPHIQIHEDSPEDN